MKLSYDQRLEEWLVILFLCVYVIDYKAINLDELVEKSLNLEGIGIYESPLSNDDEIALEDFNRNINFVNERYQVRLPWKSMSPDLPDNNGLAIGRFKSLLRRLQKDDDLLQKYAKVIQDQIDK